MTNRRCVRGLGFAEFLTLRGRPFSSQHPHVSFTCLLLMSWFDATFAKCVCSRWQLSPSLTSVFQKPIVFFCVCAGPPSVLRFYTESTGSPSERAVITPTQKPQPDHQSAATAAAAAMVRHEICFEGTIFTWCDGADVRWSRGDKKCARLLGGTLITSRLSRWSLISGIYVLGKHRHGAGCSVLGKSQLNSRLMSRRKIRN